MRYALYGDATTHKFALLQLRREFVEGDKLPILATERWFDSARRPSRHCLNS